MPFKCPDESQPETGHLRSSIGDKPSRSRRTGKSEAATIPLACFTSVLVVDVEFIRFLGELGVAASPISVSDSESA